MVTRMEIGEGLGWIREGNKSTNLNEYWVIYRIVKSLYCMPKTNRTPVMLTIPELKFTHTHTHTHAHSVGWDF